ncbi:MAG: right-handed parallel beta-helix repeat-containing protein, partial [Thermoplasmatales archaeon]|nr:right-handed parallel beta-helix repeat-containing protein [Thermoplasmatales archaeon]
MNRKLITLLITLVLLLTITNMTVMSTQLEPESTTLPLNKRTIYVDDGNKEGPWDGTMEHPYRHIQDGVVAASDGDIIYVFSGEYYENIVVDKSITLFGENRKDTIIDGMYREYVVHVIEDCVAIEQFTIRNSGGYMDNAGIKLDSESNVIRKCIIYRTKTGVYVNGTNDNEINNCTFHTNGEGIYLRSSNGNEVTDCYFSHNALGLNIGDSNEIEITDCHAQTNGIGFFFNNSSNIEV